MEHCLVTLAPPSTPPPIEQSYLSSIFKQRDPIIDIAQQEYDSTLDLGEKEASGRFLLGVFMNIVRRAFALKYPTEKFFMNIESLLTKYAVNEAVAALTQVLKEAVRNVVLAV